MKEESNSKMKMKDNKFVFTDEHVLTLDLVETAGFKDRLEMKQNELMNDKENLEKQIKQYGKQIKDIDKLIAPHLEARLKTIDKFTKNAVETLKVTKAQLLFKDLTDPEVVMIGRAEISNHVCNEFKIDNDNPLRIKVNDFVTNHTGVE